MEKFKIWILILFTGLLLLSSSRCIDYVEKEMDLNGQKSGLYVVHHDDTEGREGISYVFRHIENIAVHAIFHYKYTDYAANLARFMLLSAIYSRTLAAEADVNWKSFLENEFHKINAVLMNPLAGREKSKTSVAVVIVDGNTITQVQVGNLRVVSFKNNGKLLEPECTVLHNVLGGKHFKRQNSFLRGHAQVTELSDVKFMVMGTMDFFGANDRQVRKTIVENSNDLKKAAKEVAELMRNESAMSYNAVIVISLNRSSARKTNPVYKNFQKFTAAPFCACLKSNGSTQP